MNTHKPPTRPTVYDSAIDTWIVLMLLLAPVTATLLGAYLLWLGRPTDASVMFLTAASTFVVTLAFTMPCRYTMLEDTLSIRCGLICYQIPYDSITRVEPSASLRSGPALSTRRVLVEAGNRKHILSPKDREAFIENLISASKNILVATPAATDGT